MMSKKTKADAQEIIAWIQDIYDELDQVFDDCIALEEDGGPEYGSPEYVRFEYLFCDLNDAQTKLLLARNALRDAVTATPMRQTGDYQALDDSVEEVAR